ncbi:DUF2652 domain-containing protein [Agromyces arachidis]|uniref:DUF2652 domain-containing protein n=1 Tax=Agromyces arachidis TaxID=766966 RepID=UPI004056337D
MDRIDAATAPRAAADDEPPASERYLLIADISGYTGFMANVEIAHGVDFSAGIPPGYALLGALLDSVSTGLGPEFRLVKLEGDAVFACAPAESIDHHGTALLDRLHEMYRGFRAIRTEATPGPEHGECGACADVTLLDLKVVLHRGLCVRQSVGTSTDLLGPAVTIAHRLLKNTVRDRIGGRPYLLVTDAAAGRLDLPEPGIRHREELGDIGGVDGRILLLDGQEREPGPAPAAA